MEITLKTGVKVAKSTAVTTMRTLRGMDPLALIELVSKCRNPEHKVYSGSVDELINLGLMSESGEIHADTKAVVLASAVGNDLDLTLQSPVE